MVPSKPLQSGSPLITLCIGTFDAAAFIDRTLRAIAAQTYREFRCILSDDCSDDETLQICENFAREDTRFVVRAQEQRKGWIGNINSVLSQDPGEYFMIISHDDELRPHCLERLMEKLLSNPGAVVAYSDVQEWVIQKPMLDHSFAIPGKWMGPFGRAKYIVLGKGDWWLPYHGLIRRESLCFAPLLRYNLAGEFQADLVWVLGLAISGEFVRVPEVLWFKHRMSNSVASNWNYTLSHAAAVRLSCARFVLGSSLPVLDRMRLLGFVLYGFARIIRWKLIRLVKGKRTRS